MKMITKSALAAAVLGALVFSAPPAAEAAGGASGAAVKYAKQG